MICTKEEAKNKCCPMPMNVCQADECMWWVWTSGPLLCGYTNFVKRDPKDYSRVIEPSEDELMAWVPDTPYGEGWVLDNKYLDLNWDDCPAMIAHWKRENDPERTGYCGHISAHRGE